MFHLTLGFGKPLTKHSKMTDSPTTAWWSRGPPRSCTKMFRLSGIIRKYLESCWNLIYYIINNNPISGEVCCHRLECVMVCSWLMPSLLPLSKTPSNNMIEYSKTSISNKYIYTNIYKYTNIYTNNGYTWFTHSTYGTKLRIHIWIHRYGSTDMNLDQNLDSNLWSYI